MESLVNDMATDNVARGLAIRALAESGGISPTDIITNSQSNATDKTYSANYVNNNFVKNSVLANLWWNKVTASTATLSSTQPTIVSTNTMAVTSTNTTFNFTAPTITLTRTVTQDITINPNSSMIVNLRMKFSRIANVEYGAKIIGTDGTTIIANPQSFGTFRVVANTPIGTSLNVLFNNITQPYTILSGEKITIQLFKRQANANTLTTTYYAGVNLNNVNYYCWNQWEVLTPTQNSEIIVDTTVSPELELLNNYIYRCVNTTLATSPSITLSEILSNAVEFNSIVTYKASNTTAPIVTNDSGYALEYRGLDVTNGIFSQKSGTIYRMNFVFNGINIICYIS
jgi:hypothetical protein